MNAHAEMPEHERPLSEVYRLLAERFVVNSGKARRMEKREKIELAKRKQAFVDAHPGEKITDAAAERAVLASPEWDAYICEMVEARNQAEADGLRMEYVELRKWEINDANSTRRREMGLHGGH